jgi:hypothetical protein
MTAATVAAPFLPIDYGTGWNLASVYWLGWVVVGFGGFEGYAVVTGHPENTLSAQVWRVLDTVARQPMSAWSWQHWVGMTVVLVLFAWLSVHFAFGWIR